jgi:hypothetical protein
MTVPTAIVLISHKSSRKYSQSLAHLYSPRALRLWLSGGAFSVSVVETQLRDHERIPFYAIDHSMLIIYST